MNILSKASVPRTQDVFQRVDDCDLVSPLVRQKIDKMREKLVKEEVQMLGEKFPPQKVELTPDEAFEVLFGEVLGKNKKDAYAEFAKEIQPSPHHYKILNHAEINGHLILELQYEHAVNFEGRKILVFDQGVTAIDLLGQKWIDPQFIDSKEAFYPIARFEPTERGWQWAKNFCRASNEQNEKQEQNEVSE